MNNHVPVSDRCRACRSSRADAGAAPDAPGSIADPSLEIAKTARDQRSAEGDGVPVVVVDRAGETLAALPNVVAVAGGLPIKPDDDVIGGAGLPGTPGVDEPLVRAGIDKVADQLK